MGRRGWGEKREGRKSRNMFKRVRGEEERDLTSPCL